MSNAATARRIIRAGRDPILLYFLFRLLTCVPPVAAMFSQNVPEENLQFGYGLIAYAVTLSLVVAVSYTVVLRSQWGCER